MENTQSLRQILAQKSKSILQDRREKIIEEFKAGRISFSSIPFEVLDEEICLMAIDGQKIYLRDVPEHLKTDRVIDRALLNNSSNIKDVPWEKMRTEHFLSVVETYPEALLSIPKVLYTSELIEKALNQNPLSIKYIPNDLLPQEIYKTAIVGEASSIQYIPKDHLTEELCTLAVAKEPGLMVFVPENLRSPGLYMAMCKKGGVTAPRHLPAGGGNDAFVKVAINKDFRATNNVRSEDFNQDIADFAFNKNTKSLRYIPEKFRTADMCIKAVQLDYDLISLVPKNLRTHAIYVDALRALKASGKNDELRVGYMGRTHYNDAKYIGLPDPDGAFALELMKVCPSFLEYLPLEVISESELIRNHLTENFDELMSVITVAKAHQIASLFAHEDESIVEAPRG